MKPFVKVCESKVLRRSIVVCCGPKPAVRKLFLDPQDVSWVRYVEAVLG